MSADAAGQLAEATAALSLARFELAERDGAWRAAIRTALAADLEPQTVAGLAGISTSRVYQIRDGRRTGPTPTHEETQPWPPK